MNQLARRLTTEIPSSNGEACEEIVKPRIRGKTKGQNEYLEAIDRSIITLCYGPAGTGKTLLALLKAVEMLKNGQIRQIIISRPAVEFGEKLGFLPGELVQKIDPYMQPILYALSKIVDKKEIKKWVADETLMFMALGYMQGWTFDSACMILDEAGNARYEQLKMFLTRMGEGSRAIISGDINQKDNFNYEEKGYRKLLDEMRNPPYIDGLEIVKLCDKDIIRSGIVQQIINKLGE
jgi:phosphate starvation-inducible PhoH-like protein